MAISVAPLAGALGARITGIDLAEPLAARTVSEIKAAWLHHLVLIFPDQRLDEDAQVRFSDYLGDRGVRRRVPISRLASAASCGARRSTRTGLIWASSDRVREMRRPFEAGGPG